MAAEWSDENTRILTELFVQQVRAGNRPNTHLTSSSFEDVAKDFKTRTGLEYTKLQLKNKWDKLKSEYAIWKKLKMKETGGGWDHERNTIKQDAEWWKKAKKDLPGCGSFKSMAFASRHQRYAISPNASDVITSEASDFNMDRLRDELATTIALGW